MKPSFLRSFYCFQSFLKKRSCDTAIFSDYYAGEAGVVRAAAWLLQARVKMRLSGGHMQTCASW